MGARLIGIEAARDIVDQFLATPFAGGRHQRRVDKLSNPVFARKIHESTATILPVRASSVARCIRTTSASGFFTGRLAQADSAVAAGVAAELDRQQNQIELIASENIVSEGGARGAGLGADQQICGGLSGAPLLSGLRAVRCQSKRSQ